MMDKILCIFGDSIVWGAGDAEGGGWADRLKIYFQNIDAEIEVYNLGIPGNTTEDVLERFQTEAQTRGGTIALFAIGINDSQFIQGDSEVRMTEAEFRSNILSLISEAQTLDMSIGFIGLTRVDESKTQPISWRPDIRLTNERIDLFDGIIKDVCEDKELPYLDVSEALEPIDIPDGIHPNAVGYGKLVSAVLPFLETRFGL